MMPVPIADKNASRPGNTSNSPSRPGMMTSVVWPTCTRRSGVTISSAIVPVAIGDSVVVVLLENGGRAKCCGRRFSGGGEVACLDERLRLRVDVLDAADHVEGLLGELVALAVDDLLERLHRVLDLHVHALLAR